MHYLWIPLVRLVLIALVLYPAAYEGAVVETTESTTTIPPPEALVGDDERSKGPSTFSLVLAVALGLCTIGLLFGLTIQYIIVRNSEGEARSSDTITRMTVTHAVRQESRYFVAGLSLEDCTLPLDISKSTKVEKYKTTPLGVAYTDIILLHKTNSIDVNDSFNVAMEDLYTNQKDSAIDAIQDGDDKAQSVSVKEKDFPADTIQDGDDQVQSVLLKRSS